MRSTNSLRKLTALCLALAVPSAIFACGSDDDAPADDEDASPGGSPGTGGSPSTGGTPNTGGTPTTGGAAGTGGTPTTGGAAGTGGTPTTGGAAGTDGGGDAPPPACDLSGTGKTRQTIAATGTQTLTSDMVWTLEGEVHIGAGETLTIEPCTRIEGTKTPIGVLVISRGGRIMANGTADEPILFTSQLPAGQRVAGDWGGVILLGRAPNFQSGDVLIEGLTDAPANQYGGTDPADDSGEMRFVRIEFGGWELAPNIEINGLTMGSVGSGTVIENIMVNSNLDDCFEWFGGTVNATNLICNNGGDDMFDADQGYTGTIDRAFGRMVSTSSTNPGGLEMDSSLTNLTPVTNVTLRNATLCGLGAAGAATANGMVLRENLTGAFDNIVTAFFDVGVDARDPFGTPAAPNVTIINSVFFGNTANPSDAAETDDDGAFDENAWITAGAGNVTTDPGFTSADCLNAAGPTAAVTGSNKGAFTGGAAWMTGQWIDWATQ